MNGIEAIRAALTSTEGILGMYLADLSDADLLVRPVPAANHIAWQLGHLINSEAQIIQGQGIKADYPALPAGWQEQHSAGAAGQDAPGGYPGKQTYMDLFKQTRRATCRALESLTDADLSKPSSGSLAKFAPTLGDMFLLVANHTLMHGGQFTIVRRKLGKPVVF